ncbi:hypothetical protein AVEN_90840-1 [Araneus ventricosus]|uniref:Uncharacterized protein n=1 Tax=Araneus ventricosus TaxID=182803 RepID=A0A4Y2SHM3_ARAVE|nr:hypothetical protein AVEN_90840-1 [Araneus ventricosus]
MSGVERKRNVINVKQKLESLQKLVNGESASTDAEDVLNDGNTISHSAALQSMETFLDYMGQRGFDYGDITEIFLCSQVWNPHGKVKDSKQQKKEKKMHHDTYQQELKEFLGAIGGKERKLQFHQWKTCWK